MADKRINLEPQDYYTQRNNRYEPMAACMPTSRAMFYHGNGIAFVNNSDLQDDDYFMQLLSSDQAFEVAEKKYASLIAQGFPPYEIHGMYHSYLDRKVTGKRRSDFRLDLTWWEVVERVREGEVIMTSGQFLDAGLEGHAFCIIGLQLNHAVQLLLADPWGDYRSGYSAHAGYAVPMSRDDFIGHVKPRPSKKWGHIII